jgi:hypothetical protein
MVNFPEKERNSVVAIFSSHSTAEGALNELKHAGFEIKHLPIVSQDVESSALRAELSHLDISEDRVVKLETAIKTGKFALIVHGTDDGAQEAFALLQRSGAEEVRFHRPPGGTTRRVA